MQVAVKFFASHLFPKGLNLESEARIDNQNHLGLEIEVSDRLFFGMALRRGPFSRFLESRYSVARVFAKRPQKIRSDGTRVELEVCPPSRVGCSPFPLGP